MPTQPQNIEEQISRSLNILKQSKGIPGTAPDRVVETVAPEEPVETVEIKEDKKDKFSFAG